MILSKAVDHTVGGFAHLFGFSALLNGMALGTDRNQRTGRKIHIHKLEAIIRLELPPLVEDKIDYTVELATDVDIATVGTDTTTAWTSTTTGDLTTTGNLTAVVTPGNGTVQAARVLIVLDKQSNGLPPSLGDIIVNGATTGMYTYSFLERFEVMHDQITPLASPAGPMSNYKVLKLATDVNTVYQGTDQTIASIATGAIFMMVVGERTLDQADNMGILAETRVWYTDA